MEKDLFVISLGGSLIVPGQININFLKKIKTILEKEIKKGKRFIIVCGGGKTARNYQKSLEKIGGCSQKNIDQLGIESSYLNAYLIKTILEKYAHEKIIRNPFEEIKFKEKILIACGWKPGRSTDYSSVILTDKFKAKKLLNLTDIGFVYDKDPTKFKKAQILKEVSWPYYRKIIPKKWVPGLSSPFDPIASQEAEKTGIEVAIIAGKKLKQVENYLNGKNFQGTKIGI